MAYEPRLTVYTLRNKPHKDVESSNRNLLRNIINQANDEELEDSYIFLELFRRLISKIDIDQMITDDKSKKSFTAYQINIEDDNTDTNIKFDTGRQIIYGKVEGGAYGRNLNRTSTINKEDRSGVSDTDAITTEFFFAIYIPLNEEKMILMIQSYSGDSIDAVFKDFVSELFSVNRAFWKPDITRYIPLSIIEHFRENSNVSSVKYTSEVIGEVLNIEQGQLDTRAFNVDVLITPVEGEITQDEFEENVQPLTRRILNMFGNITRSKGKLKNRITRKESTFDIGNDFNIKPVINLDEHIEFNEETNMFEQIENYCFQLLEDELIDEIFNRNAAIER